jgi:hypothetical protein
MQEIKVGPTNDFMLGIFVSVFYLREPIDPEVR